MQSLTDPKAIPSAIAHLNATAYRVDGQLGEITPQTKLLPVDQLVAVIEHLERGLVPIGRGDRATFWGLAIISAYPRQPDSFAKDAYLVAIGSVLADLPDDLARETVDIITRKLKFMPTRAEIAEVADDLINKRRAALIRAKRMADEHQRRAHEAAEAERIAKDKAEFFANGGAEKLKELMQSTLKKMNAPDQEQAQ